MTMRKKLLCTVLSLSLAGASAAYADAHHPGQAPAAAKAEAGGAVQARPSTAQLLQNAKQLQQQAARIARAKTADERQRLLQEHMASMQEGMMMTRSMMAGAAQGGPPSGGMMGGQSTGGMMGEGMMGQGMMGQGMMGQGMMGQGMMGGHGMARGMGPGMMGHHMMDGPMMMDGLPGLELSDDQRKRVNAIHDGTRKQHWELMGKLMDEQAKLRDLYAADKLDPKAIGAEYQRIFDLRRQMIESHLVAHNQVEEVLAPEQRKALRDSMARMPRGGMMGY